LRTKIAVLRGHDNIVSSAAFVMPREGAIIFRDLVGKLDVRHVECAKCGRSGQCRVDRLILRYGIDATSVTSLSA